MRFRVSSMFRKNTIYDVMVKRGWKETERWAKILAECALFADRRFGTSFRHAFGALHVRSEDEWDILWADRDWVYEVFDNGHLMPWQRLNHFRNGRELCRKDLLVKNVKRAKRTLEKEGK